MNYADFKIPVITEDGERLGVLSSVRGPFMRVSRGWLHRDYWIPTEYITEATAREVIVGFPARALPKFSRVQTIPPPIPAERDAA